MARKRKSSTRKTRGSRSGKSRARKKLAPTLGPAVCKWIEANLVHAEGDYLGKPFRLRPYQRRFVWEVYELRPSGSRRYRRVLLGMPKGNGKTELLAAIACAEVGGPVQFNGWKSPGVPNWPALRTSPDVPVAAASFEQADILFGAAKTMIQEGPLAPLFELYDTEVLPIGRAGRLYRVAAAAGTNDGRRPTFLAADELHEWEGRKERVHLVLSNGRAKRADSWECVITTAGWNLETLLGRMCLHGQAVEKGKARDPEFLFRWYEASPDHDLDDPEQLEAAIREANPAAGDFLPIENLIAKYHEIAEHEFRRYYLNQWTSVPEQWMPPESWDAAADRERVIEPGTPIALGFDGSYNQDSTALIGCVIDERPHLITLGVWERPEGKKDWKVPKEEVLDAIEVACATYDVRSLPSDDTFGRIWASSLEGLAEKGIEVIEWPTRSPSRMAPACGLFWGAIADGTLTHDGDERLTAHLMNCRTKTDRFGPRIVKEHRGSAKKIDAAVAAVISYDMCTRLRGELEGSDHPGLTILG